MNFKSHKSIYSDKQFYGTTATSQKWNAIKAYIAINSNNIHTLPSRAKTEGVVN
ncbi:MAG: hypothetical protein KBG80_05990 [Breznakibacter sp.]|nr:hypothetical protein [Breznakibacter sp.]